MAELARIGIAIPEDLREEFDRLIEKRGYATRSEAVRDLIRKELVDEISASPNAEVYGTVTARFALKLSGFVGEKSIEILAAPSEATSSYFILKSGADPSRCARWQAPHCA